VVRVGAATAPARGGTAGTDASAGGEATAADALPRLTAREVAVVELAAYGLTNGQIAERLDLSTHAVKFHLSSAYGKLGVANRTQAAVAYLHLRDEGKI
jgi:DNA-binding NarL/FixJ family response regulator